MIHEYIHILVWVHLGPVIDSPSRRVGSKQDRKSRIVSSKKIWVCGDQDSVNKSGMQRQHCLEIFQHDEARLFWCSRAGSRHYTCYILVRLEDTEYKDSTLI